MPSTPRRTATRRTSRSAASRAPGFLMLVVVALALNWVAGAASSRRPSRKITVPYSPTFLAQVESGQRQAHQPARGDGRGRVQGEGRRPGRQGPRRRRSSRRRSRSSPTATSSRRCCARRTSTIEARSITGDRNIFLQILLGFGPVLLIVGLFVYMARRASGGGGGLGALGNFARSRAKRVDKGEQRVTFKDVAGIDESKAELLEVVDFLKNPDRYQKLGGRIPRGVLLAGQPGTGKTLLARAIAGEADVPFFSQSAPPSSSRRSSASAPPASATSSSRPRRPRPRSSSSTSSTPSAARAPAAPASARGSNDEREQTLNQILTEMDGFDSDATVIVLAATNRPEVLDSALLRPGRFDRRVTVPAPDLDGRQRIFEVHTRSLPLDDDVDLAAPRRHHARHGRRRHRQPLQRGRAAGRPPRAHQGQARGLHGRAREDHPRRAAQDGHERGGPPPHRLPRGRPRRRRHAHRGRRPRPQGLDHPARPRPRRHVLRAGQRPRLLRPPGAATPRSTSRSAAASPRRSSSTRSPPAPSPTSSRSPASPAPWSAAGA